MKFVFLPLELILSLDARQHSLQHVKIEVQNCAFFGDLSTITNDFFSVFSRKIEFQLSTRADFLTQSNPILWSILVKNLASPITRNRLF